jgi:hypothetical protein
MSVVVTSCPPLSWPQEDPGPGPGEAEADEERVP